MPLNAAPPSAVDRPRIWPPVTLATGPVWAAHTAAHTKKGSSQQVGFIGTLSEATDPGTPVSGHFTGIATYEMARDGCLTSGRPTILKLCSSTLGRPSLFGHYFACGICGLLRGQF